MIVADASALVKLALHEPASETAYTKFVSFIDDGEAIASPDIALIESINAIWKHYILLKNISERDFETALNTMYNVWSRIEKVPSESISKHATDIAVQNRISVYDSLYLAQCRLNSGKLFTFDNKLVEVANRLKVSVVRL